jgi:hypothetical protein
MLVSRRGLLTGSSAALISAHAQAFSYGLATLPTHGLIVTGDSITGCNNDYPYQALGNPETGDCGVPLTQSMQTYYSRSAASVPLMWRNMGISGTRLNTNGFPDLVPLAPVYINPVPGTSPFKGLKMIFTTGIGANDLFIGSYGNTHADQYAAAVAALCVSVKNAWTALGATCVAGMCTGLPSSSSGLVQSNWTQFNTTLTGAGWAVANGIDYIIDIASQAIMGNWNTPGSGTTYYSDGLHPTVLGHSLLAPIFLAGVNTLIGLS